MKRRRFAVVGLGSFGFHLARFLYELGHDVLAVDRDEETLRAIEPHCSEARRADASDKDELEATGIVGADVAVVGLGPRIDASILATLFLKELGTKTILAKAVSLDHGRILARVGASEVIHPERDVAVQLAQSLADPDVLERIPFLEGYALVKIRAPRALWGQTLAGSGLRRTHGLSVALIQRHEGLERKEMPARPEETIREGDVLVVLAKPEDVDAFREANPAE